MTVVKWVAIGVLCASPLLAQETQTDPAPPLAPADPATPAQPVDWKVRRNVYFQHLLGVQAIYETIPGTVNDQLLNLPSQWGRGGGGLARRFASQYGQFVVSESIELGISAIRSEDPQYHRMGGRQIRRRLGHAAASVFVTRNDRGGRTVAISRLSGVYGSWAIAACTWNPSQQCNAGRILFWGSYGMSTKIGINIYREFWPDVKKLMHRK